MLTPSAMLAYLKVRNRQLELDIEDQLDNEAVHQEPKIRPPENTDLLRNQAKRRRSRWRAPDRDL
jgi:hypothetical protein